MTALQNSTDTTESAGASASLPAQSSASHPQAATVKILHIGDVVAEAGMKALARYLPEVKERYTPDGIIINGENIVNGKGLTDAEAKQLFKWGADVITTGNHIWENWKSRPLLASDRRVLRPHNYPPENPGSGAVVVTLANGTAMGVIQVQGRTYMQSIDCPFRTIDSILEQMQHEATVIVVDFHAEATGEKGAMGWFLDGRVSAVLGTHTHVQTNDAHILPRGTAFVTDVGMTGAFDSVLGMKKEIALNRFLLQTAHRYESASEQLHVSGAVVEIDTTTGTALSIDVFITPPLCSRLSL
jgi:metallophosphoesterase (TIGR00282 family)